MSQGPRSEDRIILELLAGRELEPAAPTPSARSEEEQVLHRLYTEVLGLLPAALEPVSPEPGAKERLLAAIRETQPDAGTLPGVEAPTPPFFLADAPPLLVEAAPVPVPALRRARRWPLALAAGLAALAVGTAFYLEGQRAASRLEVERLTRIVARRSEEQAALHTQLEQLKTAVAASNLRLAMVTQPGALACRLEPEPGSPELALARGVLYIAGDHQHWFLKVTGLPAVAAGQAYQLWFLTGQGVFSGGTFRMEAAANAEISSPTMPAGVTGAAITIEAAGGAAQPTGRRVLAVAETMRLL